MLGIAMINAQQMIDLTDPSTWKYYYHRADLPIVMFICGITLAVQRWAPTTLRWLVPVTPLVIGALIALGVQLTSPYDAKEYVLFNRAVRYGGLSFMAWFFVFRSRALT